MNTFGPITFEQGSVVKQNIHIDSINIDLPVIIISGNKPGKTVLVSAGVHSCEYVGVEACFQLIKKYKPEDLIGNLVVIPVLNRTGFEARLPSLVPEDGKNLNRMFPGDENGSFSQKLAYYIEKNFFPYIDFYMDLHSGEAYEDLKPYIYFVGNCSEEVSNIAREAAKLAHVDFMVKSSSTTGCYNYAGVKGIPSLLLERGESGRWSKKEVEEDVRDINNILIHLGLLEGEIDMPEKEPYLLEHPLYQNISTSGIWRTDLKAGDHLEVGQMIGYVTDYFGNILEEVYAEHSGDILYLTKTLWADKDTEVITYTTMCNGVECNEPHHHHAHCGHHHDHDHEHNHKHNYSHTHGGDVDMENHFR